MILEASLAVVAKDEPLSPWSEENFAAFNMDDAAVSGFVVLVEKHERRRADVPSIILVMDRKAMARALFPSEED